LEETVRRLLPAVADMAWWYGWSVQSVYDLELEEFDAFLKEAARQMKAGYRKGA
jgi:phage P2 gpE